MANVTIPDALWLWAANRGRSDSPPSQAGDVVASVLRAAREHEVDGKPGVRAVLMSIEHFVGMNLGPSAGKPMMFDLQSVATLSGAQLDHLELYMSTLELMGFVERASTNSGLYRWLG